MEQPQKDWNEDVQETFLRLFIGIVVLVVVLAIFFLWPELAIFLFVA